MADGGAAGGGADHVDAGAELHRTRREHEQQERGKEDAQLGDGESQEHCQELEKIPEQARDLALGKPRGAAGADGAFEACICGIH